MLSELTLADIDNPETKAVWTEVAREFFAESGYPGELDPEHFWMFWSTLLNMGLGKFFVTYSPDGRATGALGAMFTPDPLTGKTVGHEQFWFVRQSERGSGCAGLRLFKAFEDECDRRKVASRFMAHIHGHNGEVLGRFYQRKGYSPADKFFRKDS